ncbi:hypothetical protein D910_11296 [Dendroctonus ponderosae]|uniref:Translation initiation factor eIF2B subunit alpha n=1 Tax=Dendroctonus ponderosae TaxID=77166 RepID=U4ULL0_DENPD|nr:hypothetical protein D910_11296 [Dendroctonus ponderosae]
MEVIAQTKSETVQELETNLKSAIHVMKNSDLPVAVITSACELFLRFITLVGLDGGSFQECKQIMLHRGNLFLNKLGEARGKIVKFASKFIADGSKILTHSRSRVVLQTFCHAFKLGKKFEVFVTQSGPDNSGIQMHNELRAYGIRSTLILDSAIGYVMEQIDFIMIGAEGVLESGGIVNKYTSEVRKSSTDLKTVHPLVDYTPPLYITLLFSDLGILTTSAVSDQLIELYM